jgi:RNA polymerase sigma-70 factor (ECF subfamily)
MGEDAGDDDGGLIVRALAGDEQAFGCLVARHLDVARRVAYVHAPAADVDDVVQEGFVRAWTQLDRLRRGEGFRPWLVAIVANVARNRRRSGDRRMSWELRAPLPGRPPNPDDVAVTGAEVALALAAVAELRTAERDVVAYRFFLDLSEAETAHALGIPAGTVKSRLSRALSHLRHELGAAP